MKKLVSMLLVLVFALAMLAGCGNKPADNPNPAPADDNGIVKIGLGHVTSIKSSKDLEAGKGATGQVDTVMVAAAFDKDGKVVSVTIDNAQVKVLFNDDLTLKSDVNAEYKTKVELKEEYGMLKASTIGKEWYQQAEALGNWMKGKTVDQIKGMKTVKKDDAHPAVPDEADLKTSVSISVQDYLAALEEAYKTAVSVDAGGVKLGLGHNIDISKSKGLGKDADGKEILPLAQVDTVMAATLFDKDGKVVKTIIDNAQTKINFDKDGKVTSDKSAELKTKVELKEEYGMKKASKIGKEWYEQAAALGDWMKGKTVDQIKGMKTVKKDDSHPAVPDEADLKASVSISVEHYQEAVAESFANAK